MAINLFRYAAFCLLVQLTACGGAPDTDSNNQAAQTAHATGAAPVAEVEKDRLVVAFGDSLYAGLGLEQGQGFAPTLEQALTAQGLSVRVQNAGVSGDTSAAGLQRLAFTLDGLPRKPDLVILGLGGNDMLRGLAPSDTNANLAAILTELQRRKIKVVLTGMLASPNMGPDYAAEFNPIYPRLARQYGVTLYPFFLDGVIGHPALILPDGIHPNDKGVQVIVAHVAPVIVKALGDA